MSSVTSGSFLTSLEILFSSRNVLKLFTPALYVESVRSLKALSHSKDTVLFKLVTPIVSVLVLDIFVEIDLHLGCIPGTSGMITVTDCQQRG